jgi:TetR/AcrR family transcriptional regulator, tetracycline repressor protein
MASRSTTSLDVDKLTAAALELLAEEGLDAITTRRLAQRLRVQGPALYYHLRDMQELFGHMAAAIMRSSLAATTRSGDWRRWLRNHAIASRRTLLGFRDGARVLAASAPDQVMKNEVMPAITAPLVAAGFSIADAYEIVSLVAALTLGFVINEQNPVMRRYMRSLMQVDAAYRHAVDALISGVERRYGPRARQRASTARVSRRGGKAGT